MSGSPRPKAIDSPLDGELDDICECHGQDLVNASCLATNIPGNEVGIPSFLFELVACFKFRIFVPTNLTAKSPKLFKNMNGKVEHAGIDVHNISVPLQRTTNNLLLVRAPLSVKLLKRKQNETAGYQAQEQKIGTYGRQLFDWDDSNFVN